LGRHLQGQGIERFASNHFVYINSTVGAFVDQPDGRVRDGFGVIWRRADNGEVGMIEGRVLPEPTLTGLATGLQRARRSRRARIPERVVV
jgi:hypothetical protein